MTFFTNRTIFALLALATLVVVGGFLAYYMTPANAQGAPVVLEVKHGDGFRAIVDHLRAAGLIRSRLAFEVFAVMDGAAFHLEPGLYRLSPAMSGFTIMQTIAGNGHEVTVTIPEGATIYDIDRILSDALVIRRGDLANATATLALEGKFFPDTYHFFTDSSVSAVTQKFLDNFNAKAASLLAGDSKNAGRDLIIASIIQKEVASSTDQSIVAGIALKRLAARMPLDFDTTICYLKQEENPLSSAPCTSLLASDFKIDSPYNTYLHQGLPPTPIGNPGAAAIVAALHPKSSPYWYYLSDPKTGKTIYAATLDEQNANRARYLGF